MAFSINGLPILLPDPGGELAQHLNRYLSLEGWSLFARAPSGVATSMTGTRGDNLTGAGLPILNYPEPPPLRINQLYWPSGLTRWARCVVLVRGSDWLYEGHSDRVTLRLDEAGDAQSFTMRALPAKCVNWQGSGDVDGSGVAADSPERLYLVPLVCERFYWQYVTAGTLAALEDPDSPVLGTWNELIAHLAEALGAELPQPPDVPTAFLYPDQVELFRQYTSAAVLLEAALHSCGMRGTLSYDGKLWIGDHEQAREALLDPNRDKLKKAAVLAGSARGEALEGPEVAAAVTFPVFVGAKQSVDGRRLAFEGRELWFAQVGPTFMFHSSCRAYLAAPDDLWPVNWCRLADLSEALQAAWDGWRVADMHYDLTIGGVFGWQSTPSDDYVLFEFGSQRDGRYHLQTRIVSLPWDIQAAQQLSQDRCSPPTTTTTADPDLQPAETTPPPCQGEAVLEWQGSYWTVLENNCTTSTTSTTTGEPDECSCPTTTTTTTTADPDSPTSTTSSTTTTSTTTQVPCRPSYPRYCGDTVGECTRVGCSRAPQAPMVACTTSTTTSDFDCSLCTTSTTSTTSTSTTTLSPTSTTTGEPPCWICTLGGWRLRDPGLAAVCGDPPSRPCAQSSVGIIGGIQVGGSFDFPADQSLPRDPANSNCAGRPGYQTAQPNCGCEQTPTTSPPCRNICGWQCTPWGMFKYADLCRNCDLPCQEPETPCGPDDCYVTSGPCRPYECAPEDHCCRCTSSTTTSTTTADPCPGDCRFQGSAQRTWRLLSSTCGPSCVCFEPIYRPSRDCETGVGKCRPAGTTTSTSTTTLAPCGACSMLFDGNFVFAVNGDCALYGSHCASHKCWVCHPHRGWLGSPSWADGIAPGLPWGSYITGVCSAEKPTVGCETSTTSSTSTTSPEPCGASCLVVCDGGFFRALTGSELQELLGPGQPVYSCSDFATGNPATADAECVHCIPASPLYLPGQPCAFEGQYEPGQCGTTTTTTTTSTTSTTTPAPCQPCQDYQGPKAQWQCVGGEWLLYQDGEGSAPSLPCTECDCQISA